MVYNYIMDRSEYLRKWRAEHKEHIAKYAKGFYKENKDELNESNKARWAQHPEYGTSKFQWRAENKDYIKEYNAEYYQKKRKT